MEQNPFAQSAQTNVATPLEYSVLNGSVIQFADNVGIGGVRFLEPNMPKFYLSNYSITKEGKGKAITADLNFESGSPRRMIISLSALREYAPADKSQIDLNGLVFTTDSDGYLQLVTQ